MQPNEMPDLVKKQHTTMTTILVMAALETLKKDFNFTSKQLNTFNDNLQKRALKLQKKKG